LAKGLGDETVPTYLLHEPYATQASAVRLVRPPPQALPEVCVLLSFEPFGHLVFGCLVEELSEPPPIRLGSRLPVIMHLERGHDLRCQGREITRELPFSQRQRGIGPAVSNLADDRGAERFIGRWRFEAELPADPADLILVDGEINDPIGVLGREGRLTDRVGPVSA
jgi:hypothetical protein